MPVLNATGVNIVEQNTSSQQVTFTVFLDVAPTAPVTVNYYLQDGTASGRQGDYAPATGTLTFLAGQTSLTISITVYGDLLAEANETFFLMLTDVTGATFAGNASALMAQAIIFDNDSGAPTGSAGPGAVAQQIAGPAAASVSLPTLNVSDVRHIEGNASGDYAYFLVTLDRAPTAPVTVNYYLQDGTASGRQGDYAVATGTLTIDAGQTSAWVRVFLYGDTTFEGNETFNLVMTDVTGAVFAGNAAALVATGTIIDDDSGAVPNLAGGIGAAAQQVFGPASASGAVPTVRISDVAHHEGNASGDYTYFLVTLDRAPTTPVEMNYYLQDGTASSQNGDYFADTGTIRFEAGQTSAWVRAYVYGDTRIEANETFEIVLTNVTGAVFEGGAASIAASATIVEDDAGPATLVGGIGGGPDLYYGAPSASATMPTISVRNVAHHEGNASGNYAYFLVTLDRAPTVPVSMRYHLSDGTASTAVSDYFFEEGTINFAAGQTSTYVRAYIYGDTIQEANQTFQLVLTDPNNAVFADNAAALIATGTIIDNDSGVVTTIGGTGNFAEPVFAPGAFSDTLPTLSVWDVSHYEGNASGNYAYFLVALNQPATAPVTFYYATQDGTAAGANSDYFATSGLATIPAGDVSTWVRVYIYGDTLIEANESFQLVVSSVSGAVLPGNAPALVATGTIVEDDAGAVTLDGGIGNHGWSVQGPAVAGALPTIRVVSTSLTEGNTGSAQPGVYILLSHAGTAPITFQVSSIAGTATAGTDYGAFTNTTVTIPAGTTSLYLTPSVYGDQAIEGDESFSIQFANLQGATWEGGGLTATATVLIRDNDGGGSAGAMSGPAFTIAPPGALNDVIIGGALADTRYGFAGDDTIFGNAGGDVLDGGLGNDVLEGGAGTDRLLGRAGTDTIVVRAGDFAAGEIIDGGVGVDTLRTMGSNIDYRVGTIASIDRIQFQQTASEATLNAIINASQIGAGFSSTLVVSGSAGQDSVQVFVADNGSVDISGWTFEFPAWFFDDYVVFVGANGNETFTGFQGLDIFFGSPGNDVYNGNGAVDFAAYIFSPNAVTADLAIVGPQVIGGNQGSDTFINLEGLAGSQLSDLLYGDGGANIILGLYGNDLLVGRGGDDDLRGAEGSDRIEGGMGADVLWGYSDITGGADGGDTFVYRTAAEGGDTIRDFVAGQDLIEVSASGFGGGLVAGQAVQFTSGVNPVASGAGGRFLYNTSNGQLAWDADGSGAGAAVLLATFLGNPALTAGSIIVTGIAASAALEDAEPPSALGAEGEDAAEQDAFDFGGVAAAPSHTPQAFGGGGAFGIQLGAWVMADPLDTFAFADGVGGFMSGEIGASLADMLDLQRGALGPDALSPI